MLILLGSIAFFAFVTTPMPTELDEEFFRSQMNELDRQRGTIEAAGQKPISIVFIGTSRLKNVTFDPAEVSATAKAVGVNRPVANIVLAINWAGFERFGPALKMIEARRPDVVVVMPEFFVEDFSSAARARIGIRYLQAKFWNRNFTVFSRTEFHGHSCDGFSQTVEHRLDSHRRWAMSGSQLRGPTLARNAIRRLSNLGAKIYITDVPVSKPMMALRVGPLANPRFLSESGPAGVDNVRIIRMAQPYDQSAYCDWAHIDPSGARLWQRDFFRAIAGDLNRLPARFPD